MARGKLRRELGQVVEVVGGGTGGCYNGNGTQTISVTWYELSYRVVPLVNEMTVPVLVRQ